MFITYIDLNIVKINLVFRQVYQIHVCCWGLSFLSPNLFGFNSFYINYHKYIPSMSWDIKEYHIKPMQWPGKFVLHNFRRQLFLWVEFRSEFAVQNSCIFFSPTQSSQIGVEILFSSKCTLFWWHVSDDVFSEYLQCNVCFKKKLGQTTLQL